MGSGQVTVGQLGRSEIHSPKRPAAADYVRPPECKKSWLGHDSSSLEIPVIYTNYQKGRVKNLSKCGGDHYPPHVPIFSGDPAIEAMTEQRPPTGGC